MKGMTQPSQKQAYLASLKAFSDFANDRGRCRRRALIDYFSGGKETPEFGDAGCGM